MRESVGEFDDGVERAGLATAVGRARMEARGRVRKVRARLRRGKD